MEAQSLPTVPPPLITTEPPPPQVFIPPVPVAFIPPPETILEDMHITQGVATAPKQIPTFNHHNNHSPYTEMIIPGQNDISSSLRKRGRGRPPKTNTSNNLNPNSNTTPGEVQDRSDEVILPAKRGRGRSIAKPKDIPKPIVGGGSRPRGRPRKEVITDDVSGSGPALVAGIVPVEKSDNGDVPTGISTTASGRPVRRPKKLNVESSVVAPVVNGDVVKPVSSGKPIGRQRKVGSVGRPRKVVAPVDLNIAYMEAQSLPTAPPPLITTEAPPPQVFIPPVPLAFIPHPETNLEEMHMTQGKQSPMSDHHNNHSPYAEMIIPGQNDISSSLPKRGRGRPPKTNTSNNPNSSSNTTPGEVQDRSDEVILPAKRGRGRSVAKPKAIPKPKPIVGGESRPRGRPRKEVITDVASGSGPALVPGIVPEEKSINGHVPTVISTTASGRPVRRPMKLNVESSVVAPVVHGAVVKPVSSGKPVGRPRKVGSVGRPGKIGGVVKKTAGKPRKVVGNNLKERAVMLLEESLGLGMNQNVPDMYLRFVQLYTIITGKEYDLAVAGATAQGNNQ